jgi:hypothetical protein
VGPRASLDIDMIYLLTAIGLSPGGSSTVHIYTQTIHRTKKTDKTSLPSKPRHYTVCAEVGHLWEINADLVNQ